LKIDSHNVVVKLCAEGIAKEMGGRAAEAGKLYGQAWNACTDAYERCIAAHYIARIQATPREALHWNREALRYPEEVDRENVQTFYPSLYLNVGKSHEDLGDKKEARQFYQLAADGAADLPEGKLTDMVRRDAAEGLKRTADYDMVGIEHRGATIAGNGGVRIAVESVGVGEIVMIVGGDGMLSNRCTDQLNGFVVLSALLSDHAQQVQRVEKLRFLLQDFPVARFRFDQVIRLMVSQPKLKPFRVASCER
jgi:hypothetical protein